MCRKFLIYLFAAGFFVALCSFSGDRGQGEVISWKEWNEGYPEVVNGTKIGLVDVYTSWCGWCKKMDRDTYANSAIINKINKDFVGIKFNPEENKTYYVYMGNDTIAISGPQLKGMLSNNNPIGYPTTFFIVQKQNTTHVRRYDGYFDAEGFADILDTVVYFAKH